MNSLYRMPHPTHSFVWRWSLRRCFALSSRSILLCWPLWYACSTRFVSLVASMPTYCRRAGARRTFCWPIARECSRCSVTSPFIWPGSLSADICSWIFGEFIQLELSPVQPQPMMSWHRPVLYLDPHSANVTMQEGITPTWFLQHITGRSISLPGRAIGCQWLRPTFSAALRKPRFADIAADGQSTLRRLDCTSRHLTRSPSVHSLGTTHCLRTLFRFTTACCLSARFSWSPSCCAASVCYSEVSNASAINRLLHYPESVQYGWLRQLTTVYLSMYRYFSNSALASY